MYSLASKDVLNKISKIFPGAMLCDVHSQTENLSINDFIERIVQRLPMPAQLETSSAIMNMKDVVDGQQLKIQMNMIEEPYIQEQDASSSSDSSKQENHQMKQQCYVSNYDHYWNPEEESHIMTDKYLSFLL